MVLQIRTLFFFVKEFNCRGHKERRDSQRGRVATKRLLKPLIDTDFHGYLKIVFEKQIEERHRVVQRICIKCSNK